MADSQTQMTRADYDVLTADGSMPCPDCGEKNVHLQLSCRCPVVEKFSVGKIIGTMGFCNNTSRPITRHINRWHHVCLDAPDITSLDEFAASLARFGFAAEATERLWLSMPKPLHGKLLNAEDVRRSALYLLEFLNGPLDSDPDKPQ